MENLTLSYVTQYIDEAVDILRKLDRDQIEAIIRIMLEVREKKGRLFILGVGGSAANCSHAVNDFRKLCGIEAYAPVDNVAELTARTNDEGWETVFAEWLKVSQIDSDDCILVFSVGGGDKERNVSANIVYGLDVAKAADACVIIPVVNEGTITPHSEAFQGLVWHLIVSDPRMMTISNKWEGMTAKA